MIATLPKEQPLEYILGSWNGFNKKLMEEVLASDKPLATIVMLNWLRWPVFMGTLDHILSRIQIPTNICMTIQQCSDQMKQNQVREKLAMFNNYDVEFTPENIGTGKPRHDTLHRALKKFTTPYIHFTDDDMRLPRYAIELMISVLEERPELGAVNIRTWPNSNIWIINERGVLQCTKPNLKRVFHPSIALGSATMVIRREVFETCDYDPEYKIGCADIDLGMQMNEVGWKMAMLTIPKWYAVNCKGGNNQYVSTRYNMNIIKKSAARFYDKWGWKL